MLPVLIIVIILFLILPLLLVWRLHRVPVSGDVQVQLMWRGAVAGVTGGAVGATLSSFIFGTGAYALIGYLYWLLITAVLGMIFTLIIGAVQRSGLVLNLFGRAVVGAAIGIASACVWASAIRADFGGPTHWFSKGVVCMMIGCGIVSGVLGGPLIKEA